MANEQKMQASWIPLARKPRPLAERVQGHVNIERDAIPRGDAIGRLARSEIRSRAKARPVRLRGGVMLAHAGATLSDSVARR